MTVPCENWGSDILLFLSYFFATFFSNSAVRFGSYRESQKSVLFGTCRGRNGSDRKASTSCQGVGAVRWSHRVLCLYNSSAEVSGETVASNYSSGQQDEVHPISFSEVFLHKVTCSFRRGTKYVSLYGLRANSLRSRLLILGWGKYWI